MTRLDVLTTALQDRYTIERELGQGGMATVYLATDVKHARQVALKVLLPDLAAVIGAERFLAEIKTTANLQHPHILPLHDSGEVMGTAFYVMPFVEGESLRDMLTRDKQLSIADAVRIATEVAGALDYAHRNGVIHRDIKPENILIHDGRALVADFGIALAASRTGDGSRMTETGMSLGTPHYMSPEQAMGERDLDARTDVYALGCVLYEMLVGEPPFTGPTAQAIVAKVMTERPAAIAPQRSRVPPEVEDATLTALEKIPADRFATASAFAEAINATGTISGHRTTRQSAKPSPTVRWALISLAFTAAGLVAGLLIARDTNTPLHDFGAATQVTWEPGLEVMPAISPDGQLVAYAAGTSVRMRIFVRQVSGGRPIPITDDSLQVQSHPQWSRDGSRILFIGDGVVYSAPATGGSPRQEVPDRYGIVTSATWSPDEGQIAFAVDDSLFIRDDDGSVRNLSTLLQPVLCRWGPTDLIACASDNGLAVTPGILFGNKSPSRVIVARVSTGEVIVVSDSSSVNTSPHWSADGQWLYILSDHLGLADLFAVRMNRDGSVQAPPVRLTIGLQANSFSMSSDGSRIAYAAYVESGNIWSLPLQAGGPISIANASQVTSGQQVIENLRVSRDGVWILFDSDRAGNSDLYRLRLPRGEPERLTFAASHEFAPELSPDGREVALHSWRTGSRDIYVLPLDGGPLVPVTSSPQQEAVPSWSPDGNALVYMELGQRGGIAVATRRTTGEWESSLRHATGFWPSWSPDGKFISFVSDVTGGDLMVMPADSGAARTVFSPTGQISPTAEQSFWHPDGQTIFFKSHDASGNASIWSVPTNGGTPRERIRIDDPNRPSYRVEWSLHNDVAYFVVTDRQSDVWVLNVTPGD